MTNRTYESSIPVFLHYLNQLAKLVEKAEAYCAEMGTDQTSVLQARLSRDMHPFRSQVQIADDFALRTCAALANIPKPDYGADEVTLAGLRTRIARTTALLRGLSAAQFDGADAKIVTSQAGNANLTLTGLEFVSHYALPNFFFHLSISYAILRHVGVNIGKEDFDGFHAYSND